MTDALDDAGLDDLARSVDGWLEALRDADDHVAAVDRSPDELHRWFVRMRGEEKDVTTVWLTLGQRTLRYETYVMPSPPEHRAEVMELLLRRNEQLTGAHFSIGQEDAVYLRGEIPDSAVTADELDRILGTVYTTVEANFRALLRLAFASRFDGDR
jgi:hypothetical protein